MSSCALIVRPFAGNPISIRSTISPFLGWVVQAVRSKISCLHWLMDNNPLFPEPFALKL